MAEVNPSWYFALPPRFLALGAPTACVAHGNVKEEVLIHPDIGVSTHVKEFPRFMVNALLSLVP
jgi:hypothetical protein